MLQLTQKQESILRYVHRHSEEHGSGPTLRAIGEHFAIRSLRGVTVHLDALRRKGYIARSNKAYSIRLTERAHEIVGAPRLHQALYALRVAQAADNHRATCAECIMGAACARSDELEAEAVALRLTLLRGLKNAATSTGNIQPQAGSRCTRRLPTAEAARQPNRAASIEDHGSRAGVHPQLTWRQARILRMVAEGDTSAEIAAELTISSRTVESHLDKIYRRLGVRSRLQAVVKARSLNLLNCP